MNTPTERNSKNLPDSGQLAAAATTARFALVIAGPGAGKTDTLIRRVETLLANGVRGDAILALSFTGDAVAELRQRMPPASPPVTVSTLHALATGIIKTDLAGYGMTRVPQPTDAKEFHYGTYLHFASTGSAFRWTHRIAFGDLMIELDKRLVTAAELTEFYPDLDEGHLNVLSLAKEEFERIMSERGQITFDGQIAQVVRRMSMDHGHRRRAVGHLRHVLVDEYQDVDPAQSAFLDHLVTEGASLWAVGDEDQSLYGFRRADVRRVTHFATEYPGAEIHTLSCNYRCGSLIVEKASNLISHNRMRSIKPPQVATRADEGEVCPKLFMDLETEANDVIRLARERRDVGETVAVLARTKKRLDEVRRQLATSGLTGVDVGTIHGAKGLQWDAVAILGFEEGNMPTALFGKLADGDEIAWRDEIARKEEERRIAYVALTRAKSLAVLYRVLKDDRGRRGSSRFLRELEHPARPAALLDAHRGLGSDPEASVDAVEDGDMVHLLFDGTTRDMRVVGERKTPLDRALTGREQGQEFWLEKGVHVTIEKVLKAWDKSED